MLVRTGFMAEAFSRSNTSVPCTADYNCGLVHQFLASLIQLAIFLGQLVRRIVHQFSAALVQVFAPLGEFLAGIENVICSIFSFTAKSAASSCT